jgi:two-component system response regulator CpxR
MDAGKVIVDRILLIDDDVRLCELVAQYLEPEGFEIEALHSGNSGFERAITGEHALVVLDVMLPDLGGFEVLRRVRAQSRLPVLMLTARGEDLDRILGLEMGADDYLPKPFNPRELAARVRAILRRTTRDVETMVPAAPERIIAGDIELDRGAKVARRAGNDLPLTVVEFDLLEALLLSAGRVVERPELVKSVLGREFSPFDRSVDVHVSNLRKKMGPFPDGTERIRGVRGAGYIYLLPAMPLQK